MSFKKIIIIFGLIGIVLVAIPLTIFLVQKRQNIQQKAAASTTLSFSPASTSISAGQKANLDITVDPGNNYVSSVKLEITFDSLKFSNPVFTANTEAFPEILSGPAITQGKVEVILAVGSDPTKVIQAPTKVGVFSLTANSTSSVSTPIAFGPNTVVLSAAPQDSPSENVLSTTIPASVEIMTTSPNLTLTPTSTPSLTPTPTPTITPVLSPTSIPIPTLTPTTTITATPTPTTIQTGTRVGIDAILNGVFFDCPPGKDCIQDNNLNNNPKNPARDINVEIFDAGNNKITEQPGKIILDTNTGHFKGVVSFGNLATGNYTIKITVKNFLKKRVAISTLASGQLNQLQTIIPVIGDVNGDNKLDILDYNTIRDCVFSDNSLPTDNPNSKFNSQECKNHPERANTDLDDNGIVDLSDYNLYLRSLEIQLGD